MYSPIPIVAAIKTPPPSLYQIKKEQIEQRNSDFKLYKYNNKWSEPWQHSVITDWSVGPIHIIIHRVFVLEPTIISVGIT